MLHYCKRPSLLPIYIYYYVSTITKFNAVMSNAVMSNITKSNVAKSKAAEQSLMIASLNLQEISIHSYKLYLLLTSGPWFLDRYTQAIVAWGKIS